MCRQRDCGEGGDMAAADPVGRLGLEEVYNQWRIEGGGMPGIDCVRR